MARLSLIIFSVCLTAAPVHLIVPPKTPVIIGFEPAAIGTYHELVCDAAQPDAGIISYKWYKYRPADSPRGTWESMGPIGTDQKYIFNPVSEKQVFYQRVVDMIAEPVSEHYKCRASNSAGTRDSEWGELLVYTPCSQYTVSVSPAKPVIGSTFSLNCYVPNPSGFTVMWRAQANTFSPALAAAVANSEDGCHSPMLRYSWSSCSPQSVSSKTKTFNLQVTNAQTSDSAYWTCKDNGLSCISNPVKLVVQAPPGTPLITGFHTGPVAAGAQVNLKCIASPPGDTYDWYKDGTKLTNSLTYNFQVKKESHGVYKCVARNTAGSATSPDKTLIVYSQADSVVVSSGKTSCHAGETDMFTCTATGGYPPPTLKIYIKRSGGTPVEVTQGQDRVMAKEDNQAEYYCVAKVDGYPSFDMTSTKKTYNVTFPNTKVSFINNPTAAVKVGQVKKFTCETDEGNPVASIKWYKYVGGSFQHVTSGITSSKSYGVYGGKIRISEWSVTATKAMNGGTVRCTALYSLTGHGFNTNADTLMNVKWSATELIMVEKPNSSITVGTSVNIKCVTDSSNFGSPGTVSWFRNGQQIMTGVTPSTRSTPDGGIIYISQLTFTSRKEDNQDKYECKINDQANFKKDVTITVDFPPSGIQLSETSITFREGVSKTITCSTTSSSNPVVSGVSLKKKLGSTEVDVTGTSRVTDGTNYGKDVSIVIKLDTNRKDNGAQYICSFTYGSTSFTKIATVNVQFNPSKITMIQKFDTAIHEGQLVTIACETDSANPAADIQFHRKRTGENWVKQTSGTTSEDRNAQYNGKIRKSTLTVTANRADNQAVFECIVKDNTFEVKKTSTVTVYCPPYPPCCLRVVYETAVSVYLTFKSNFSGGSDQTFTIEQSPERSRRKRSEWVKAAENIPDPGFEKDVFHKVNGLKSGTKYQFRVKGVNADGSSGYNDPGNGMFLKVTTKAAPDADLVVTRKDNRVTVSWSLERKYSKIQIEYCPVKGGGPCLYHDVESPAKQGSAKFDVNKAMTYKYSLVVFDGDDKVFVTAHKVPPTPPPPPSSPNSGVIGGGAAGGVLLILVIVAVTLTVVFIKKRRAEKREDKRMTVKFDNTSGEEGPDGGPDSGPVFMNIDNKGFNAKVVSVEPVYVNDFTESHTVVNDQPGAEPEYDELQYEQRVTEIVYEDVSPKPSAPTAPKKIDDITVEEFKQWLMSKQATESTYNVLAENGFSKAAIFMLLEREDIKGLHIKPLGQEVLVRNLVKSFNMISEGKWSQEAGASSGDAHDDMENPYAELNITPDVIADQVYTDLRPSKK